jgi:hypothetical protein
MYAQVLQQEESVLVQKCHALGLEPNLERLGVRGHDGCHGLKAQMLFLDPNGYGPQVTHIHRCITRALDSGHDEARAADRTVCCRSLLRSSSDPKARRRPSLRTPIVCRRTR